MSANTQTLGGPASKPSAERAETTSSSTGGKRKRSAEASSAESADATSTGTGRKRSKPGKASTSADKGGEDSAERAKTSADKKRKTPEKASELADKGGAGWSVEDERTMWWMRHRLVDGGQATNEAIGQLLGRTALAVRGAVCKLRKEYMESGYDQTFGQPRPAGLGEPGENLQRPARPSKAKPSKGKKGKTAAADRASEKEAHRLAKEEAADLSEAEVLRLATEKMAIASQHLRKHAKAQDAKAQDAKAQADEAAEWMARGSAQFRGADGRRSYVAGFENNKTTEFADPKKQARVEISRAFNNRYHTPVPVDPDQLDAAEQLLRVDASLGARLSPNPQFATQRSTPQDPRLSINHVMNDN